MHVPCAPRIITPTGMPILKSATSTYPTFCLSPRRRTMPPPGPHWVPTCCEIRGPPALARVKPQHHIFNAAHCPERALLYGKPASIELNTRPRSMQPLTAPQAMQSLRAKWLKPTEDGFRRAARVGPQIMPASMNTQPHHIDARLIPSILTALPVRTHNQEQPGPAVGGQEISSSLCWFH